MEPGDFFVQDLRQHVDLFFILVPVLGELDLRDDLVGETGGHDEARMTRGAAQVEQTPLGEDHHAMAVREDPLVVLRLDVLPPDAGHLLQAGHIDLVVEVADVADDGLILHARHVLCRNDVLVSRGRHEDVGFA